jgi:TolB-like protein/Tfp pilus assembly protein PilF
MIPLLERLRERKLFQWALAYLAGAWVLFQGIEVMAEPWDLSPGFQRTVHLLVAVGFLVTLVLAWYHGEKGRQRVSGTELVIIALLLGVGALLIRMYRPEEAAAPGIRPAETARQPAAGAVRSLAVLPLANLMGDPEQAYFVDGLHDILIGELAGISELTVISRTSVMRYRDTDRPLGEIAAELGVDALVEGSVFHAGDSVRVTALLVRGAPEEHLWQGRYEGRLSQAFGLQTQVAEAIAQEIRFALPPREAERLARRTEVDPAAQEAYLRGRALWRTRAPQTFARALAYMEQAVGLDSTFALAWSGLADVYTFGSFAGGLDVTAAEANRRAKESALKAVALDPGLAEAHIALAANSLWGEWDIEATERSVRRALQLNPNLAQAHNWMGEVHLVRGRLEDALASFRRARDLDPFSALMNKDVAKILMFLGRCDQAIEAARTALELDPGHALAYDKLRHCLRAAGSLDEAAAVAVGQVQAMGLTDAAARLRVAYDSAGWEGLVEAEVPIYLDMGEYIQAAYRYAEVGRLDEAFDALFVGIEAREVRALNIRFDPLLEPLSSDARWDELLQQLGF